MQQNICCFFAEIHPGPGPTLNVTIDNIITPLCSFFSVLEYRKVNNNY